MSPDSLNDAQIEGLLSRWDEDPRPRLSLQLAGLYRQRGRLVDALEVLAKGLESYPDHVSVRVALGRYRLEAGNPEGAAEALLEVVGEDPSHLVANKLLVRAYLALGDRAHAADRLDLYAVLNDSDPELEILRAEVAATQPAPAEESVGSGSSSRTLRGALDRAPFEELLSAPLAPAPLDLFALTDTTVSVPGVERAAAVVEQETAEPDVESVEDLPWQVEEVEEVEPVEERGVPAVEAEQETSPIEASDRASEEDATPREVESGAAATATLGALYLAQGHLDEAQSTFEQVLARDPEDAEARAGLEELARRRGEVEAEELEPAGADLPGATARKIRLLADYLGRIRAAAARSSG